MKLEDYGFIGNMRACALVASNGSMDWLCLPRFDSNACFAGLLGVDNKHGCWRIAPRDRSIEGTQRYRPDTLILETTFETPDGTVRVIDFMPPLGLGRDVVRIVEGVRGIVPMKMRLVIRYDYGRTVPWVWKDQAGLNAVGGPDALVLRTNVETHGEDLSTVSEFSIGEGDQRTFVLSWHPSHERPPEPVDPLRALEQTEL